MNSFAGRVPSDGGTKLVGAAAFSLLASSSASRPIEFFLIGSATRVDVLRHTGEYLVYLVWRRISRDVDL